MSEQVVKELLDAGFLVVVKAPGCSGCKQQDKALSRAGLSDMVCVVDVEYNNAEVEFLQSVAGPALRAPTTYWRDQQGYMCSHGGPMSAAVIAGYVENGVFPDVVCEAWRTRSGMGC